MRHTYFFEYNLPAENHKHDKADHFINVVVNWHGGTYTGGEPIVFPKLLTETIDLMVVKDWSPVLDDIETISRKHFAGMAKQQRIDEARKVLAFDENPIIERLTVTA